MNKKDIENLFQETETYEELKELQAALLNDNEDEYIVQECYFNRFERLYREGRITQTAVYNYITGGSKNEHL